MKKQSKTQVVVPTWSPWAFFKKSDDQNWKTINNGNLTKWKNKQPPHQNKRYMSIPKDLDLGRPQITKIDDKTFAVFAKCPKRRFFSKMSKMIGKYLFFEEFAKTANVFVFHNFLNMSTFMAKLQFRWFFRTVFLSILTFIKWRFTFSKKQKIFYPYDIAFHHVWKMVDLESEINKLLYQRVI